MIKEDSIGKVSLEGKYITGRSLSAYESFLGFNRHDLKNKRVLNFGSGRSTLHDELNNTYNIVTQVIDIDSNFAALQHGNFENKKYSARLPGISKIGLNRHAVQADGCALPFGDNTFDEVLALWSTYQIPLGKRKEVFSELLRVGKVVRIAPILSDDEELLHKVIKEKYPNLTIKIQNLSIFGDDGTVKISSLSEDDYLTTLGISGKRAIITK